MRVSVACVTIVLACSNTTPHPTVATKPIHEEPPKPLLAPEADADIPAWYDLQPLLADLRPEAVASERAGSLGELPLYDFDLHLVPNSDAFLVDERVFFQNDAGVPLSDVYLRIFANTPPDGDPPEKLDSGHCVGTRCDVKMVGRDVIAVHLEHPLKERGRLRVVLHVTGHIRTIDASKTTMNAAMSGSLKALMGGGDAGGDTHDYGLLGWGDDILSFGNFYPVLARHERDKWDLDVGTLGDIGPDAMGHVHAHVDLPSSFIVAASGAIAHEEVADGRRRLDVVAGCMRDFALLASEKFVVAEREVNGVHIRSFFRESDRATGEKVLDVGAWSFKDFEKRFGPYPYTKLDLVEQSLVAGAGGVEFPGLATVASMFYKPSGSPQGGGGLDALLGMLLGSGGNDGPMKASLAEFTTAHEVGHQWWHVLVGSDSRKHPWQDEALAQFSAMLYVEDRYGVARAKREGDMNARMAYEMMRMLGHADGAVDAPAGNQSQMVYGGLVYGKGPYYLVALRKALGDGPFFAGLQAYVKQYYLGFAPPHALADAMTAAATGKSAQIASLSHRWLEESHGDEDLGKADMASLLSMATGGQAQGGGLAGMGDLGKMLQGLGSGGGAGSPDMMKMLQQMMGK